MTMARAIVCWFAPLLLFSGFEARAETNHYRFQLNKRAAEIENRRQEASGIIPLLELLNFWPDVPEGEIENILELTEQKKTHPLVLGYSRLLAGAVALHHGKINEAWRLFGQAGISRYWWLLGPFDNRGNRGHEEVFPVEQDLQKWPDIEKRFSGKEHQNLRWRQLAPWMVGAPIPLAGLLNPGRESTAYLLLMLQNDQAQPAALRLGTNGSYKVFLNGRIVAAKEVRRQAKADQDVIRFWLPRGKNWLTLKVSTTTESGDVYARLTGADGGELPKVQFLKEPAEDWSQIAEQNPLPEAKKQQLLAQIVDPRALLEEKCAANPEDIAAKRDLAMFMARLRPDDAQSQRALQAVNNWVAAEPTVEGYMLQAGLQTQEHEARASIEKALALAPQDLWVRHRLARLRLREQHETEAIQIWEKILEERPGFLPAQIKQIENFQQSNLPAMAAAVLDKLLKRHPQLGRLLLLRASLAIEENDLILAEQTYRKYLQTNKDDLSARKRLADLLSRQGNIEGALSELDTGLKFAPTNLFLYFERARLWAGQGNLEAALAEIKQILAVDALDARAWEELGNFSYRLGRKAVAWQYWQRSLQLKPQNASLRGYLAFLNPVRGRGWAEKYRRDTRPYLKNTTNAQNKHASAVVLLDHTVTEVFKNGLSRMLNQRLVKINSQAGVKRNSEFSVQFNPDTQSLEIKTARVHKNSGRIIEAAAQEEIDLSEPWAGIWYDMRARVVRFAGLAPGDVIEVEYTLEDIAADNMFADYFGSMVYLQEDLPVDDFSYVLVTPREKKFYFRHPKAGQLQHKIEEQGERRIYRWNVQALPSAISEPGMPGMSEVSDYLHISTYQHWQEVSRWYAGLLREPGKPDRQMRELVQQLVAGKSTELEKIRALHNYVMTKTRYVGLEFGIHGYKPYPAAHVLARKFGDCKDKATLLAALLKLSKIEAQVVLVRTKNRGEIDPFPASLALFDHAIVYVPKYKLYIDGTAEFSGTNELPAMDQGVITLHVDEQETNLRRIPLSKASQNQTLRKAKLQIMENGTIRQSEKVTVTGTGAAQWRSSFQAADERRQRYEKYWNEAFGGARVIKVEMSDLEQLEKPVRIEAELVVQGMIRKEGERKMALSLVEKNSLYSRSYARLSMRKTPLLLDFPFRQIQTWKLIAPANWRFETPMANVQKQSSLGIFNRVVKQQSEQELEINVELEFSKTRIEPAEYGAFRAWLNEIDRQLTERITLVRR